MQGWWVPRSKIFFLQDAPRFTKSTFRTVLRIHHPQTFFQKNPSLFGNTLDLLGLTGVKIIQNVSRCAEISSFCFSDFIQKDRDAIMLRYVEPICSLNDVGEEMESK